MKIHIIGCGSATPTLKHYCASHLLETRGKVFMIDCGDGTQMQLRRTGVHFQKIQAVFISHIHGDHCFGLIGMISTFGLLGRTAPLSVFAPKELRSILEQQIKLFCSDLSYDVVFQEVDTTKHKVIYEDRSLTVETIPLCHGVPTCGFVFREKPSLPHIKREMIDFYNIPLWKIQAIKEGEDWITEDGKVIPNHRLTEPAAPPPSYAYCSDTRYIPDLYKSLLNISVLYHESTYGEDCKDNAVKYKHSTAREAALVARDAKVGKLLLGHYSSRYHDEKVLLSEAKAVFEESYLTNEGMVIEV